MRSLPLRSIWQIVSEINLAEIQREIEAPFHLLVAADDEADAEEAARWLSDPGAAFCHPWLTITDSAGSGLRSQSTDIVPFSPDSEDPSSYKTLPSIDCALLVTTSVELSDDLSSLLRMLRSNSIPALIVLTGAEGKRPDGEIARWGEQVRVAIAEWSDEAVIRLAGALIDAVPSTLRLPLARRLPPLRTAACNLLIQETSQVNAGYSFTTGLGETVPGLGFVLGAGDAIVLTKNQLMMAYKIALVSGKSGSPQKLLGEIVGVLGGGFLFRQLAREMVGLDTRVGNSAQSCSFIRRYVGYRKSSSAMGNRRSKDYPGTDEGALPRSPGPGPPGSPANRQQRTQASPALRRPQGIKIKACPRFTASAASP